MHWSDVIALELINLNPGKEEFVLAAGISPSGTVHIGNFRDIATVYLVSKALQHKGKKTIILLSWDEYDRFRKVPKSLPENKFSEYENYIGKPYSEIPDPYGCHSSYAEHYEKEFEESLLNLGVKFDIIRYQAEEYKSRRYTDGILIALRKRKDIYDIMQQFKTQEYSSQEREAYYPISIYCENCGKDCTCITGMAKEFSIIYYKCKCGYEGTIDIYKQGYLKLSWKVDWPMRWMYENVDFEPGGKDHASPQGSYQVSRVIAKEIYRIKEPLFQGYEFIGIKGLTGKMSGSSGLNISMKELLKIYPPEIIWWFYAKKAPNETFDISLGDDVPRIYGEFDKIYNKYYDDKVSLDANAFRVLDIILRNCKRKVNPPFNILSTLYSISNQNVQLIEDMFQKIGMNFKIDELLDRLAKVSYWLKNYSPEMLIKLRSTPDIEYYNTLSEEIKSWISLFCSLIKMEFNSKELTSQLYAIPRKTTLNEKENRKNQLLFFKTIYRLLIAKDNGPVLSTLIIALGAKNILPIIEPLIIGDNNMIFISYEEVEKMIQTGLIHGNNSDVVITPFLQIWGEIYSKRWKASGYFYVDGLMSKRRFFIVGYNADSAIMMNIDYEKQKFMEIIEATFMELLHKFLPNVKVDLKEPNTKFIQI